MAGPGAKTVGKVGVRIVPDTTGFKQDVERYLKELEKTLELKIPVVLDDKPMAKQLETLQTRLKKSVAGGIKIPVTFEGTGPQGGKVSLFSAIRNFLGLNKAMEQTQAAARNTGKASEEGGKGIRHMELAVINAFEGFGVLGKLIGGTGAAILSMGRAGAEAASGASTLGSALKGVGPPLIQAAVALAQVALYASVAGLGIGAFGGILAVVAPAVLSISGAIGILGVGLGTVMLGMDGITKAAGKAKPALDELKKRVSAVFEERLKPMFEDLNNRVIPIFYGQFVRIANALSELGDGIYRVITSTEGIARLDQIFNATFVSINRMRPVLESMVDSFLTLAQEGSKAFSRFAAGPLKRVADDFAAMMARLQKDGTLAKAFDGLGSIVEGLLFLLNDLLEVGTQLAAEHGQDMGAMLKNWGEAIKKAAPEISKLLDSLIRFLDWLALHAPEIVKFIRQMTDATEWFASVLASDNPQGDIGSWMERNSPKWMQDFSNSFDRFFGVGGDSPVPGWLQRNIVDPIKNFGWDDVLSTVKGWGSSLWDTIKNTLIPDVGPVSFDAIIGDWIDKALPKIGEKLSQFGSWFWGAIKGALGLGGEGGAAGGGTAATIGMDEGFRSKIQSMIDKGRELLPQIPTMIGEFFGQAYTASTGWMQRQVDDAGIKWELIKGIATVKATEIKDDVSARWAELKQNVGQRLDELRTRISEGFEYYKNIAWAAVQQLKDGAIERFWQLVDWVKGLGGRISDAIGDLWETLKQKGRDLIQGFIDGIKSKFTDLGNAAKQAVHSVTQYLPGSPAEKGPLSGTGWAWYRGQSLATDLAAGMIAGHGDVANAALQLAHAASPELSALASNIKAQLASDIAEFDPDNPAESLFRAIMAALDGARMRIDGDGVARLVADAQRKLARR